MMASPAPRYFALIAAFTAALTGAGPIAATSAAPAPAAVAAKEWWQAFGSGKLSSLASKTGFPFRFATTMEGKDKDCEGAKSDAKGLEAWLQCMQKNHKVLIKVAKQVKESNIHVVDSKAAAGEVGVLGDVLPKVRSDEKLVYTYLHGGSVTFLFVVSVSGTGPEQVVRDFMMNAELREGD